MALDKKHKAFRFPMAMPIDANNVIFEQAFARLLVLVRTKGLPITTTTKATLHPEDLVEIIVQDKEHFQGIKDDPQRKRLLKHWLASDFTTCVKEGRGRAGEARIASMKPIHMSTIKLLDPCIRSQDRDVSVFLYNIFRDSGLLDAESLLPFLTLGTTDFGEHDLKIHESEAKNLDIEALFLLRLLEHFKVDMADRRKKVATFDFLCLAQKQLIINDTARLLVYKQSIPRRELIQYLMMLLSFHTALYCIKTFSLVNGIVETRKFRCGRCQSIKGDSLSELSSCDHHPDLFVDLTNGQNETCDELAKDNVARHYAIMYRYFRSHYKLAKLDEFARTFAGYTGALDELVKFMGHRDVDAYFRIKVGDIRAIGDGEGEDTEIKAIVDLKLPPFDAYVEILTQKTFKTRMRNHKALMASLCGLNRDDGFLHGARGQKRKYVMGNQLLELLVQLAVVDARSRHGQVEFYTKPITITDFVKWLGNRYGILIDTTKSPNDSPEVARALEANYSALKDRLRQLGFFTDLSDACGTGGFIVVAFNYVSEKLRRTARKSWRDPKEPTAAEEKELFKKIHEAGKFIFGLDFNANLVKTAQMNMVMNNDGRGGLFCVNSLLKPSAWPKVVQQVIELGTMDIVMTNPPFGTKIKIEGQDILDQYDLAHVWRKEGGKWVMDSALRNAMPPEILFIERCVQFLRPGKGKLGIVLPDGVLGNPDNEYIRYWIMANCQVLASVDLPVETFLPRTGTQTSVLILRRKSEQEKLAESLSGKAGDYQIFMAMAKSVGKDRRGKIVYVRDPEGREVIRQDLYAVYRDSTLLDYYPVVEPSGRIVSDDLPAIAARFSEWSIGNGARGKN